MAVCRRLHDNPHTHFTHQRTPPAAAVYMTDGALKYMAGGVDSVTHMQ